MEEMSTREKLKKLLSEWEGFIPEKIVERDFDYRYISSRQILSIVGPRRAGKTYLCFQIITRLRRQVPRENILYINFEDERIHPLKGDELSLLLEVYEELYKVDRSHNVYLFVDEIQNVPDWGRWCRRIHESRKDIKLVITGSSSKLLSRELATELRGRTLTQMVFPYSFSEFLRAKKMEYDLRNLAYGADRPNIKRAFNEYLEYGGFPQIAEEAFRKQTLQNYYSTVFYKDLIERFKVKNFHMMEDFLRLMMDGFSSLMSLSKMEKKLKSIGHKASKSVLKSYLSSVNDIFLLFSVKKYAFKRTEQLRHPVKIYSIDTGLVSAVRFSFSDDFGRHMENCAFVELARRSKEVYYHSDKGECDFLVRAGSRITEAIQVTRGLTESSREREVRGLLDAMKAHHLQEGLILTEDDAGKIEAEGLTITVKPLWLWLLE